MGKRASKRAHNSASETRRIRRVKTACRNKRMREGRHKQETRVCASARRSSCSRNDASGAYIDFDLVNTTVAVAEDACMHEESSI